ncbi:MAG: PRC-barrel domain containing protein [candidate division Zixibacteria bacterium]|nr:PRC-barrel domain containing protein [candidate division Zixibacteria bacterium]NIR65719.1 PRC-barrel domain containing protein [candidate division Zixibacteria bacterium]NIS16098.1 PRC-barrel domain containing protein [candidate division Zixibacteria bacterium]NIS47404.1 PRC-barrel domain containing protein [candidate division Zixibacteria bacterium]NIT52500.1 PRC-barrel domain containing protein [candidate division Zixibacteria bacterium]
MLRRVKELLGYEIEASDGKFGKVDDFLFDDEGWTIRYLVIDTGKWLPGRKVLISPLSLGKPDWTGRVFPVELTKQQIEDSPPMEKDEPVSRQHEERLSEYYNLMPYWTGGVMGGTHASPVNVGDQSGTSRRQKQSGTGITKESDKVQGDPHLRSCDEVLDYRIKSKDNKIGHVEDYIVDDDNWLIRYLAIDTRNWLPGRKVLVAVPWIEDVNWGETEVSVDMTKEEIKNSPEYDPSKAVNRQYEETLYDFYGRPKYW